MHAGQIIIVTHFKGATSGRRQSAELLATQTMAALKNKERKKF